MLQHDDSIGPASEIHSIHVGSILQRVFLLLLVYDDLLGIV